MFGFVVADAGALSEEEKERYRAVYCGLCFALRDRYGTRAGHDENGDDGPRA